MNSDELKKYIQQKDEHDYLLVDVRQPEEYERGHIPGAKLIPLRDLVVGVSDLPSQKDIIFYCRSGGRSAAAATFAEEEEVSQKAIYDLEGGIMAWDGITLADYPKVKVFDKSQNLAELLFTAMDLEKGAFRFYNHVKVEFEQEHFSKTFAELSNAEVAHAKAVYAHWKDTTPDPPAFEQLFDDIQGEILEGGQGLIESLERVKALKGNTCLRLLELALFIENSALDLYRAVAEQAEDGEAQNVFLSISQAEKGHMNRLIEAIGKCE